MECIDWREESGTWSPNNDNAMVTITFQGFALSNLCGHNYTESTLQLRPGDTIGTSRLTFVTSENSWIALFVRNSFSYSRIIPNAIFLKSNSKVTAIDFFAFTKYRTMFLARLIITSFFPSFLRSWTKSWSWPIKWIFEVLTKYSRTPNCQLYQQARCDCWNSRKMRKTALQSLQNPLKRMQVWWVKSYAL